MESVLKKRPDFWDSVTQEWTKVGRAARKFAQVGRFRMPCESAEFVETVFSGLGIQRDTPAFASVQAITQDQGPPNEVSAFIFAGQETIPKCILSIPQLVKCNLLILIWKPVD